MKQAAVVVHGAFDETAVGVQLQPRLLLVPPQSSPADPRAGGWVGLHGSGVVAERFVTAIAELRDAGLENHLKDPRDLGATIRGSLTLYGVDDEGAAVVLPDPLGSGLVFRYRTGPIDAVSSDLGALVDTLALLGYEVRKSLAYVLLLASIGSGGLRQTPYEGVEVLAPGTWLRIDGRQGVQTMPYPSAAQLTPSADGFEQGLERTREDVLSNVRAVAAYGAETQISHLTGGIDSRLVVAALRHLGKEKDFLYYCMGGPGDPDYDVASRISAQLPLRMTTFAGYVERKMAGSWQDHLVGSLNATSGVGQTLATVWGVPTDTTVLSGGYGEFLRSFYNRGAAAALDPGELAEYMFGQFSMGRDDAMSIIAPPLKVRLVAELASSVSEGRRRGVADDAVLDYLYMTGRNRFFVGEISRALSSFSHRFDPLYSVAAGSAALAVPGEVRQANVLGLDLLLSLDRELASMPFDRDRYSGLYEDLRGLVARVDLPDGRPEVVPRPRHLEPADGSGQLSWQPPRATPAQIATARRLGMAPRLLANYEIIRQELPTMLTEFPATELAQVLNLRLLRTYLQRPPTHRVIYRGLTNLYAGLSWYLYGDELGQVSKR
ncbi:hypothetical protein [Serinicoccus marinus]|uniref:hypothetical protein n=1 Tax=Serinicoccus marinus TaxID=247333 RepID=UPI002490408F|nr:hypothetical protein [Serinicoccus marinus]